ncbi:MAG: PQQ-binding-like beta-propeller repeat protein [Bacteroidales bacterium]|nr:PQQ-binding-like beta-propeller repeat protein [Bacteroidales bacterium]
MFKSIISLVILTISSFIYAQEGRIYEDLNLNGQQDQREKGIANVVVSDGFSICKTDEQGRFSLKLHEKARFVTVYTPSGYRHTTPYYIDVRTHREQPFNFGLNRDTRSTGTFLHLSDIEERSYLDWIDDFKDYLTTRKVDFVAITGDICYEAGLRLNGTQFNTDQTGTRMVYTLGNHDLIKGYVDAQGRPYGEKLYEDFFGPCWYAFNAHGIHYLVTPMLSGDATPSYSREDLYQWMQADLATVPQGTPIIIFNHGLMDFDFPEHNIVAYIYGHNHINYHYTDERGIQYLCTMAPNKGGNDHSPSCWREFSYQDHQLTNRLHYYPIPKHLAAQVIPTTDSNATNPCYEIAAIVYDGKSDVQRVELIGDSESFELKPLTEFCWSTDRPVPADNYRIRATFSDGEVRYEHVKTQPATCWKKQLPGNGAMGGPLILNDLLYAPLVDDQMSQHCGVIALDKTTGEERWFFHTSGSVRNELLLAEGLLFAADLNARIYALDPQSGKLVWEHQLREGGLYPTYTQGIGYHDGIVYVGQGAQLTALSAQDGKKLWKNTTNKGGGITDVSTYAVGDGVLVANAYWVGRYGFDAQTGELLWEKRDAENRYSSGRPIFYNGKCYYTAYQTLIEMDPRTGTESKRVKQPHIFNTRSCTLIADDVLVVGTSNHGMTAYRLDDFSQLWNTTTMPALIYTSPYTKSYEMSIEGDPIPYEDKIIFGANDGYLYCITRDKGAYVWRYEVGLPILSNPVIDGEFLYVLDLGGGLTKLRVNQ